MKFAQKGVACCDNKESFLQVDRNIHQEMWITFGHSRYRAFPADLQFSTNFTFISQANFIVRRGNFLVHCKRLRLKLPVEMFQAVSCGRSTLNEKIEEIDQTDFKKKSFGKF